ncbi:hypothetical protein [Bradyrhizobium sp. WD16]|uniref:hypothetical protein n=1 Tax=Bradyrhizobium sp. WD16 TaxID=1521768 RepID=UPI0020A47E3D|nr:hypothetical protein [Bradyrhizobium sp. WD16]
MRMTAMDQDRIQDAIHDLDARPEHLLAHAREVTKEARHMPRGARRDQMRRVARVYHLLARQSGWISPLEYWEDYRIARRAELQLKANRDHWQG